MSKLNSLLGMALMMGAMGGMPEAKAAMRSMSSDRRLSYHNLREDTPHYKIQQWFLGLDAENQKRIVDLPYERQPNDTANAFLIRRNLIRAVQYFIKKNPNHPDLKYKADGI